MLPDTLFAQGQISSRLVVLRFLRSVFSAQQSSRFQKKWYYVFWVGDAASRRRPISERSIILVLLDSPLIPCREIIRIIFLIIASSHIFLLDRWWSQIFLDSGTWFVLPPSRSTRRVFLDSEENGALAQHGRNFLYSINRRIDLIEVSLFHVTPVLHECISNFNRDIKRSP